MLVRFISTSIRPYDLWASTQHWVDSDGTWPPAIFGTQKPDPRSRVSLRDRLSGFAHLIVNLVLLASEVSVKFFKALFHERNADVASLEVQTLSDINPKWNGTIYLGRDMGSCAQQTVHSSYHF